MGFEPTLMVPQTIVLTTDTNLSTNSPNKQGAQLSLGPSILKLCKLSSMESQEMLVYTIIEQMHRLQRQLM